MFMRLELPKARPRSSSISSTSSVTPSSSPQRLSSRGWTPSGVVTSPPITTLSDSPTDYFSVSPRRPRSSSSSQPPSLSSSPTDAVTPGTSTACYVAYPSWPVRASLILDVVPPSPTAAAIAPASRGSSSYSPASSRISDDDLAGLDFSCRGQERGVSAAILGEGMAISWSATRQPSVVPVREERRRRLPPPPVAVRRSTSKGVSRHGSGKRGLNAIAE